MPTDIKLKNSVTATNAPTSLQQGEVAINITDKKVWVGNAATTPVLLLGSGADGTFTNLTVSGVASFADGTVSLPSITNIGDTNTGIFFPAADTIAFTEGGAEAMRIDANGNIGVGTASPTNYTNQKTLAVNGTTYGRLDLMASGTVYGFLYGGTGGPTLASSGALPVVFETNGSDRMRIDASGNVGIKNATPQGTLDVGGVGSSNAGDLLVTTGSTTAEVVVGRQSSVSSDNTNFRVRNRVNQQAFFVNAGNRTAQVGFTFGVGDATPATTGAGITFPATQSASSDANTLDDYEEGTWTPVLSRETTAPTISYSFREGRYTKIGNMVTCWIVMHNITVSSAGSGTNSITGLPFATGNQTYSGTGGFGYNDAFVNTINSVVMNNNLTKIFFGAGTRRQSDDNGGWANGGYLGLTFTYFVA
jgi:hypothetical protein